MELEELEHLGFYSTYWPFIDNLIFFYKNFVRFWENRPTKDYSCQVSYRNSDSKCHLRIDYEMVALTKRQPPL